jgi:hypothetical protein
MRESDERDVPSGVLDVAAGTEVASRFQRDLYLYWQAARDAGGLALGVRHYLSRSALRHVRERMDLVDARTRAELPASELDDLRLFFARRLLQRLGLLRADTEGRLVDAEASEMARFLALSFAERLRLCARLWVAGGWWSDRPDAQHEPSRPLAPAPPRIAIARRHVLQRLVEQPVGAAVLGPAPDSAPRTTSAGSAGRLPRSAPQMRDGRGRERDGSGDLDETARAALLGPLQWLGLVEPVGGARSQSVVEACRTTAAISALRAPEAQLHEAAGRVVVQANFDIVALPPLTASTLFLLDNCAERRGSGQAATYLLTRTAFAAAQRTAWMTGGVAAQLEQLAGVPLPQNVQVTLADWERQVQRLRLRAGATILEIDDAAVLDRLLADPRAANWIERRLTAKAAVLDERHVEAVRSWLLRRGEMPALRAAEPGVSADPPAPGAS